MPHLPPGYRTPRLRATLARSRGRLSRPQTGESPRVHDRPDDLRTCTVYRSSTGRVYHASSVLCAHNASHTACDDAQAVWDVLNRPRSRRTSSVPSPAFILPHAWTSPCLSPYRRTSSLRGLFTSTERAGCSGQVRRHSTRGSIAHSRADRVRAWTGHHLEPGQRRPSTHAACAEDHRVNCRLWSIARGSRRARTEHGRRTIDRVASWCTVNGWRQRYRGERNERRLGHRGWREGVGDSQDSVRRASVSLWAC
ncbi:hypothetical protein C8Q80DRAFT_344079 [Daedaleopsis nitida]|nr:hypothetical protein C8Q80DRAFT_344079 [Daedaleopsis nitida]